MNEINSPGGVPGGATRPPTLAEELEKLGPAIKEFRKQIDGLIQAIQKGGPLEPYAFEAKVPAFQAYIHLTNAKMWCGKILEAFNSPFPADLADKANGPTGTQA